ncbi:MULTISPECIES: hypothetical protein [Niallia]|uniref:hypothetical protein n=1 Tax=Niallia TaxID=2837506 RepID=UPI0030089F9E
MLPTIINEVQSNVLKDTTLIEADSEKTGQGIYVITLPYDALEIILDPAFGYINSDGSPLNYAIDITWSIMPDN